MSDLLDLLRRFHKYIYDVNPLFEDVEIAMDSFLAQDHIRMIIIDDDQIEVNKPDSTL